jgi:hypothetical protein
MRKIGSGENASATMRQSESYEFKDEVEAARRTSDVICTNRKQMTRGFCSHKDAFAHLLLEWLRRLLVWASLLLLLLL